jgi:hypothetical protein
VQSDQTAYAFWTISVDGREDSPFLPKDPPVIGVTPYELIMARAVTENSN